MVLSGQVPVDVLSSAHDLLADNAAAEVWVIADSKKTVTGNTSASA